MSDHGISSDSPIERLKDIDRILRVMRRAAREAVEWHRRLGYPIVEGRDGKVVWVQPEDIEPYDASKDADADEGPASASPSPRPE